jgi:hypothetical protein
MKLLFPLNATMRQPFDAPKLIPEVRDFALETNVHDRASEVSPMARLPLCASTGATAFGSTKKAKLVKPRRSVSSPIPDISLRTLLASGRSRLRAGGAR